MEESQLVEEVVDSEALQGNLLEEPSARKILVYLPPGYERRRQQRYPVVYLLSGLGGDHRNFALTGTPNRIAAGRPEQLDLRLDVKAIADELITTGVIEDTILVGVSGMNSYGNHWYGCSEVIGDYRDQIARDIVAFVDRKYRTRAERNSRALVGHSSGAHGALTLALEYPEVFGAAGLLSPAANDLSATRLGESTPVFLSFFLGLNPTDPGAPTVFPVDKDIPDAAFFELWGQSPSLGSFFTNVIYALGAAYSPNSDSKPWLADLPVRYPDHGIVAPVWNRWLEHDLVSAVERAPQNLARTPIHLAHGTGPTVLMNEPGDIPLLIDALRRNAVSFTLTQSPGDHFTSLPATLRSSIAFVINNLGSQDDVQHAPLDTTFSAEHARCRLERLHRAPR